MRWFKAGSVGVLTAALMCQPLLGAPNTELGPIIETQSGKVIGIALPSGVLNWLGIPFAAPPTNDLRWKPPQKFSWNGVWRADRFMPECIQNLRPHNINNYFGEEPSSEDCLYLNVWAPAKAPSSKKLLPVIVYIFGGGNTIGSPGMGIYNGEKIAARGAIFVSVNYRLGLLGFMAHPELTSEQGGHSGNYAYLDQNAALKWVQANISRFGGDPSKVSLVGQSAGAGAVAQHLASPLSEGLFSSAVMLSACRLDGSSPSLENAEQVGRDVQQRLGSRNINEMRMLPADKILAVQPTVQVGAIIDGYFQPRPMIDALQSRQISRVPVIAASTGDDSDSRQSPLTKTATLAQFRAQSSELYGPDAHELISFYGISKDDDVKSASHKIAQDAGMQGASRRCAQQMQSYGLGQTFIALFDRKHSYEPAVRIADTDTATVGAYHSSDVPFWLGTLDAYNAIRKTRSWTADDRDVSTSMMDLLIAFARTGIPSTQTVNWPAWSPERERRLEIGRDIRVEPLRPKAIDWLAAHRATTSAARTSPRRDAD